MYSIVSASDSATTKNCAGALRDYIVCADLLLGYEPDGPLIAIVRLASESLALEALWSSSSGSAS